MVYIAAQSLQPLLKRLWQQHGLTAGVSEFEAPFWLLENVTYSHTEIPELVTDFTCPIYSTCCVEKES